MGTITIKVNDEVEKKFREVVRANYPGKKGDLGKAVTEALQKWIEEKKQKELAKKERGVLRKGFDLGKLQYKRRVELYER